MSRTLHIAAKAPVPGQAKTRLAQAIGAREAADLYRAFLVDLAARFAVADFEVGWYATPPRAWASLVRTEPWAQAFPVLSQPPGDWTERQRALFRGARARGERDTVLIASDSPHVGLGEATAAFEALGEHDLVLGPAGDDGYYLIGMRDWHDVLAGVTMSEGAVLEAILARARGLGLTVKLLEPTFDVDEAEDLDALRGVAAARPDLAATRATLARIVTPPRIAAAAR